MNENLDNVKRILAKYLDRLNELDKDSVDRVLRDYTNKLMDLFDSHRINGVNLDMIIDEIREEARYGGKRLDGEERRDTSKRIINRNTDARLETIDKVENDEKKWIVKRIENDFEGEIEEEKKESIKNFTRRLDDLSEIVARTAASYMRRAGYYNFEDFIYDLRQASRSVVERNLGEYEYSVSGLTRNAINNVYDEIGHIQFLEPEIELSEDEIREANKTLINEKGIDVDLLEDTYRKYVMGELGTDEKVDFKADERPISLIMQRTSEKRALAISEVIMQNNILNENTNLMDSKQKFEIVQRDWYDMLITEEEFKAMEQERKKSIASPFRQYSNDVQKEKLKDTKNKNDDYEFEEYL